MRYLINYISIAIAAFFILNSNIVIADTLNGNSDVNGDLNVKGNVLIRGPKPWVDVTAWGANGNDNIDDWQAIQNAIDSIKNTGGTVFIPVGNYIITKTLRIGLASSIGHHTHILGGAPTGGIWRNNFNSAVTLIWDGKDGGTMLDVRYAEGTTIEHLRFHGCVTVIDSKSELPICKAEYKEVNRAGTAMHLQQVRGGKFSDIAIRQVTEYGIRADIIPGGVGAAKNNYFERIFIELSDVPAKAVGLLLDGDVESNSSWHGNTFINGIIQINTQFWPQTGIHLRAADHNSFFKFDVQDTRLVDQDPVPGSSGLKLEEPTPVPTPEGVMKMENFPNNNAFYGCSIQGPILELDEPGTTLILPWHTFDSQVQPSHSMAGFNDRMQLFGEEIAVTGHPGQFGKLKITGDAAAELRLRDTTEGVGNRTLLIQTRGNITRIGALKENGEFYENRKITYNHNTGNLNLGRDMASTIYRLAVDGMAVAAFLLTYSDEKDKINIELLDDSLMKIMKLRGISYQLRDPKKDQPRKIGVIAQEVERVFPEVVFTDEKGKKSVAYGALVAPLIEAIKEQQFQIQEQNKRIEHLEALIKGQ